jgi:hypothetical protein
MVAFMISLMGNSLLLSKYVYIKPPRKLLILSSPKQTERVAFAFAWLFLS